jgi:DNA-binding IclR family transcriptional regulator
MSLQPIRNAVEMTTHPKLSQLVALLVEHRGLTVSAAAPLLDLPPFMVRRFADRLVRLGYATRTEGRYYATKAGQEIDAVMHPGRLLP